MSAATYERALRALADIATAKDVTLELVQRKAMRVYQECTDHNSVRRYKLTIFDISACWPASQERTEEITAYSAEDAVYQFRLKQSVTTFAPIVESVEPA